VSVTDPVSGHKLVSYSCDLPPTVCLKTWDNILEIGGFT
jgi:hypothetical protein